MNAQVHAMVGMAGSSIWLGVETVHYFRHSLVNNGAPTLTSLSLTLVLLDASPSQSQFDPSITVSSESTGCPMFSCTHLITYPLRTYPTTENLSPEGRV